MTNEQIRARVEELNLKTQEVIETQGFILGKELAPILAEIQELQKQCAHEYKNKKCVYCFLKEN